GDPGCAAHGAARDRAARQRSQPARARENRIRDAGGIVSNTTDPKLDTCGCCETVAQEKPISNPLGQPQLRYRIDTQPTFLQRMLNALPHQTVPPGSTQSGARRPLGALTARSLDDPTVALLDAWATVTDVMTFYQERIANEGFLRTATERR